MWSVFSSCKGGEIPRSRAVQCSVRNTRHRRERVLISRLANVSLVLRVSMIDMSARAGHECHTWKTNTNNEISMGRLVDGDNENWFHPSRACWSPHPPFASILPPRSIPSPSSFSRSLNNGTEGMLHSSALTFHGTLRKIQRHASLRRRHTPGEILILARAWGGEHWLRNPVES